MTKRDKLRRKIRNNPYNVHYQDLETLLIRFDFVLKRIKGSHHFFVYKQNTIESLIMIPVHGKEVKPQYVRDTLDLLDELFPTESDESDTTEADDD